LWLHVSTLSPVAPLIISYRSWKERRYTRKELHLQTSALHEVGAPYPPHVGTLEPRASVALITAHLLRSECSKHSPAKNMQPPWQVNDNLNTGSSNTQVHFELHNLLWQTTNYSKALVCWSHDDLRMKIMR
jgi:hypothetical protein